MDEVTLFPIPKNKDLKEEISKSFKLHCSNVNYDLNGNNIENISNTNKSPFIKSGLITNKIIKENLITTNHIERSIDNAIDFNTDPVEYIDNNEYIQKIKNVNGGLYNLIYNALNNGVFFRNATTRRSFNYWQPLSNAGIPAVPRGDAIHETTFLVHDIMHNLIPDLQIDKNDELNKAVYIIHRVLGEGICLVLADMYFIDALSKKVEYDFEKKNIYQAFKHIQDRRFYDNLKANGIYAVTGIQNYFDTDNEDVTRFSIHNNEDIQKYLEWFRPVYISDLKWTFHNIEDICKDFESHKKWVKNIKPFLFNNDYKMITTNDLIEKLGLNEKHTVLSLTNKIFDFIYNTYIETNLREIKSLSKEQRSIKAKNTFYSFQSKIFFTYNNMDSFKNYYKYLLKGDFEKLEELYQKEIKSLLIKEKINIDDFRVFKEVYPHFNSFFISYDADKVVQMTLKDYSEELFLKLFEKR